jgi:hypothetical protein
VDTGATGWQDADLCRAALTAGNRATRRRLKELIIHALSVALHYMHYNFCRIHKMLRVTPAMAAGVTDRVWDMTDIAAVIAAQEALVAKRGSCKKRAA